MMQILYRPMVKEALILVVAGVIATMLCSLVYAAQPTEAGQAVPDSTAIAPAQGRDASQLAPTSKEDGRQMLLSAFHGQVPLASPTPAAGR